MKIHNPPESSALMATARSFGNYDLAAALADLIDNSIKTHATNISISFIPDAVKAKFNGSATVLIQISATVIVFVEDIAETTVTDAFHYLPTNVVGIS